MTLDPRVARSRAAVLAAAKELLVSGGPNAVTVDAVVAASGVAKTTIYRHWPSRNDLVVAVFESLVPERITLRTDLPFEEALRAALLEVLAMSRDPEWRRTLPAMFMLKNHVAAIAEIEARMHEDDHLRIVALLERGAAEGRVRPDLDPTRTVALLFGPVLFSALAGLDVDESFVDDIVDRFLSSESAAMEVSA